MKKKVFFIMNTDDFSGAESVNLSIVEGLKDKIDFYWVCKKGNINNYLKERNIKWIEINKLCVKEIKRIVKENKPDILHATDFKASVICALANTGVYLIEHLHNNSPWLKKLSINSIAFLYAGLKADKILTVSESIEKEYIFSRLIKNKIECIGNPISMEKILKQVNKDNYIKKYDICCVARLTEQKNPQKFIEIIEKVKKNIPKIKCIWIGKGELEKECKKIVEQKGLKENIDFIGFQKNPYQYMAASKIFLLTSSWEGFGLVAFEALTLGLPCVVSDVGGLPNIVNDKCGIVTNNKELMVDYINKLLMDNTLLKEISINAVNRAKKINNIDSFIMHFLKIYNI